VNEDLIEPAEEAPKKRRDKRSLSKREKDFIKSHYANMTDREISDVLGRPRKTISKFREIEGLVKNKTTQPKPAYLPSRTNYLATLDEHEKQLYFRNELRKSALYRSITDVIDKDYLLLYEQKYVEFMMDPSIETVTAMERDIWHEMTLAQIREIEYLKMERDPIVDADGNEVKRVLSREIAQCQDTIRRCQESLNVERKQRLKHGSDQSINFAQIVKELRSPEVRRKIGERAAMLKYIAEKHHNQHLNVNIISGANKEFNLGELFKDGQEPDGLDGDFTGEEAKREKENSNGGLTAEI